MTRRSGTRAPSPEPSVLVGDDQVAVVFIGEHTHEGTPYAVGDKESFPSGVVERMLRLGSVELDS